MLWRALTALVTAPVIGTAGILGLLMVMGNLNGCSTYGRPVYSPTGASAARVEDFDAGATGGSTIVVLYTQHGFHTRTVFMGGWKSVQDSDLSWQGLNLTIRYDHYEGYDEAASCSDVGSVHVHCVPQTQRDHQ